MVLRSTSGDLRVTLLPIRGAYVARKSMTLCAQLRDDPCAARDGRAVMRGLGKNPKTHTHEVEHESEPDRDLVGSGRCRIAGVSRDGEDATLLRSLLRVLWRLLRGRGLRTLHAVDPESAARLQPRFPRRQQGLIIRRR